MSTSTTGFVLVCLLLSSATVGYFGVEGSPVNPDDVTDDEGASQSQNRMHNGAAALIEDYPFMAAIYKHQTYLCSGSLLSGGHILTAAHCFTDDRGWLDTFPSDLKVSLGNRYLETSEYTKLSVKDILMYSNERVDDRGPMYDVAILVLYQTPITTSKIQPIEVVNSLPSGDGRALGWGLIRDETRTDELQTQEVDIKDSSDNCPCHNKKMEFCAVGRSGPLCAGDSGGPLVKWKDNAWHVAGVFSGSWPGGLKCSNGYTREAIYFNVASKVKWIQNPKAATNNPFNRDLVCSEYEPSSSTCFPGTSLVHIKNKPDPVAISSLQPGDQVLTLSSSGQPIYSPFISYLHSEPSTHTQYITIHTQHNHTLHVSHNHLLYKANTQTQLIAIDLSGSYVFAGDIKVGDIMIGLESNITTVTEVTAIEYSFKLGVYAPLTDEGTIVVDGVFASCYATSPFHHANHVATLPYRMWVKAINAWYGYESKVNDDQVMPAYIKMLYLYGLPVVLSI